MTAGLTTRPTGPGPHCGARSVRRQLEPSPARPGVSAMTVHKLMNDCLHNGRRKLPDRIGATHARRLLAVTQSRTDVPTTAPDGGCYASPADGPVVTPRCCTRTTSTTSNR